MGLLLTDIMMGTRILILFQNSPSDAYSQSPRLFGLTGVEPLPIDLYSFIVDETSLVWQSCGGLYMPPINPTHLLQALVQFMSCFFF